MTTNTNKKYIIKCHTFLFHHGRPTQTLIVTADKPFCKTSSFVKHSAIAIQLDFVQLFYITELFWKTASGYVKQLIMQSNCDIYFNINLFSFHLCKRMPPSLCDGWFTRE